MEEAVGVETSVEEIALRPVASRLVYQNKSLLPTFQPRSYRSAGGATVRDSNRTVAYGLIMRLRSSKFERRCKYNQLWSVAKGRADT